MSYVVTLLPGHRSRHDHDQQWYTGGGNVRWSPNRAQVYDTIREAELVRVNLVRDADSATADRIRVEDAPKWGRTDV